MENKILKLLAAPSYTASTAPQLLKGLSLTGKDLKKLEDLLQDMEVRGKILRTKGNRYIQAREADLVPGVIQITRGGRGFVQPEEAGLPEIAIVDGGTSTAMHGDRVLVRLEVKAQGLRKTPGQPDKGRVVRVLERKRTTFVGTLERGTQFLQVRPDDPRLPGSVFVPEPKDVGRRANLGDKVVVEILRWEGANASPEGQVIEVLGAPDAEGVDMLSVIRHYELPLHFPREVLAEANEIAGSRPDNQPSAEECKWRVDCRDHNVITIDPDDAKDFDDAICIQRDGADKWRLWVHIADVSHYVKPGSPLDVEAKKRGNSTYLVDRVIPMLPEALSNELCSLKPDLDRLTKCVEFSLNKNGGVISSKFYSAVIRSKRRFTYQEAFTILQRAPKGETEQMLHDAHQVAQHVRKTRFKNGSLELDFPEHKIRLDERGKVLRIDRMENDASHQLIEEYMLLANEAVAAKLMSSHKPAVYRIHEAPKEKKLNDFREDVLSHRIPCGNLSIRAEVQKLLAKLNDIPAGAALKIGFLKSLMRARYAIEPLGHYGLAKTKYTHFTSPIRRYADLVVHRAVFEKKPQQHSEMKIIAEHISATERVSSDAERDSREVKLYAYLKAQIDSDERVTYAGLVTDIRNFGFFVDVEQLGMSGLVPLSAVRDDFYVFDPARGDLFGKRTRRSIKLGDKVEVQVYQVDSFKKQVDFQLAREGDEPQQGAKKVFPRPERDKKTSKDTRPRGKKEAQSRKQTQRRR
jgi:ribonuclease R